MCDLTKLIALKRYDRVNDVMIAVFPKHNDDKPHILYIKRYSTREL